MKNRPPEPLNDADSATALDTDGAGLLRRVLASTRARPAENAGTMQRSLHFTQDLDRAALELTAYIANPSDPAPSAWEASYEDLPYLLKSLLRRALVMEAQWFRLTAEALNVSSPAERQRLTRQASQIAADLLAIQSAIYKISSDQGLTAKLPSTMAMADADLPEGTTSLERVRADDEADAIYEDEFGGREV